MKIVSVARAGAALLFMALALALGAPAQAQQTPACPQNAKGLEGLPPGIAVTCSCTAAQMTGSIWGTDRYTTDSSICKAARHAGVVPPEGGLTTVYVDAGCASYTGTARNDISTDSWGAYQKSFGFTNPVAPCAAQQAQQPLTPPQVTTPQSTPECPPNGKAFEDMGQGDRKSCSCSAAQMIGSVWGTMRYTNDSSICAAAVHSGTITRTGGIVTLFYGPGCPSFTGTARNGITTGNWASYDRTFAFQFPIPGCVTVSQPGTPPGSQPGSSPGQMPGQQTQPQRPNQPGQCDPAFAGKYSNLLRTIAVPQDRGQYGVCNDYGPYNTRTYAGYTNLPNGYWTYAYPNWYIWGARR